MLTVYTYDKYRTFMHNPKRIINLLNKEQSQGRITQASNPNINHKHVNETWPQDIDDLYAITIN